MKTKLIPSEPAPDFKPFTIEITVETIQEARCMFHITNSEHAAENVYMKYSSPSYSTDYASGIPGSLWRDIKQTIESQGFKI